MAVAKSSAGAQVREAALAAFEAGLIVIPPTEDGVKRPLTEHFTHLELARLLDEETARVLLGGKAHGSIWKHFLDDRLRPDRSKIENWYRGERTGLGIATGKASGNLEALDFDDRDTFLAFCDTADASALGDLVARIRDGYSEATPSGGVHLLYRCNTIAANLKLARRPAGTDPETSTPKLDVLVETRGEGGYLVVAPSCGPVHETKRPYQPLTGGFASIARITPDEREDLFQLARAFDECARTESPVSGFRRTTTAIGERPGDRFNSEADWRDILEPHGWTWVQRRGDVHHWRRPGKDRGISATTNFAGSNLLYVFSSSTVFDSERGYSPFAAFTILNYAGNFAASARALQEGSQAGAGTSRRRVGHGEAGENNDEQAPLAQSSFPLTEQGNAERLIAEHGQDIRFCPTWGKFLCWDGRRWSVDETGEVHRRAVETVRHMLREAAAVEDKDARAALVAHQRRSESKRALDAMISLATHLAGVSVSTDQLDANPWLLNVTNGTLDLRTGDLRPHQRGDCITKLISVAYDPKASCPTWHKILERILPSLEVRRFVQKAVGYTLTGHTGERVTFILHGTGANGKSTLFAVMAALLGEYARRTPTETLLARNDNPIPNDVARLKGARFAYASEAEEGRRLAESLLKDLTGGDKISARFMRGEWFEFEPEFKIWLGTNHKPMIRGTDRAIWDRIRLVPFDVVIPPDERIPRHVLLPQLTAELPGILAWAVEGCLAWQSEGLKAPSEVRDATEAYRSQMDVLSDFLAECCVLEATAQATAKALHDRYTSWCADNGEKPMSQRGFALRIQERGCKTWRGTGGKRSWAGIRLIGDREVVTDSSVVTDSDAFSGITEMFSSHVALCGKTRHYPSLGGQASLTPSDDAGDPVDEVIK